MHARAAKNKVFNTQILFSGGLKGGSNNVYKSANGVFQLEEKLSLLNEFKQSL